MDIKIEKKRRFTRRQTIAMAAAVVVVGVAVWAFASGYESKATVSRTAVKIATVERGEFNDYIRVNGQVQPISVVQLSPEEGGIVKEKVVEEGAAVRQGDIIVRLSNSNLDLQILSAESELAEKQNLLRNTQVTMQQNKINNESEKLQLDLDVSRKRRTFEQYERLWAEQLISHEEYVQAKEDYELATRQHKLISERLYQDSIYRTLQMEQMEDNLANMRRNVLLIRKRKDNLDVRSAIDGELSLLDVELGQNIAAGQMIGQVSDLSDYKVEMSVDEHYIDRVRPGLEASIDRQGKVFKLKVRKVYPEVREGKFRVDLVFDGERPDNIRTGQTYYMDLQLGQPTESIIIPHGTFFATTGGTWIFVLDDSGRKAYRRTIKVSRQNPQSYEVTEGLAPGERVIVSGYEAFKDKDVLILE